MILLFSLRSAAGPDSAILEGEDETRGFNIVVDCNRPWEAPSGHLRERKESARQPDLFYNGNEKKARVAATAMVPLDSSIS